MGYFSCQTLLDPLLSHRTGGSFVMFILCLFVQQSLSLSFRVLFVLFFLLLFIQQSLSLTFRVLFVVFWLLLFVQQSLRWPSEYVNICSRLREGIPDLLDPRFAVFLLVRSAAVSISFAGVSFSSYWPTTCSTPALLIFKTKLVLFLWFPVGVEKTSPNLTSSRTGDDSIVVVVTT